MSRTNSAAVILILGDASAHPQNAGDYDGSRDLPPFIDSATAVVDRVNTCATNKGVTLTSTELELIERWLAAHLYAMSDQQLASKNTQGSGGSFRAAGGLALDGTTYGQTAKMMDPSGCLNAIGSRRRAWGAWLGKPPSEQTDYVDRD